MNDGHPATTTDRWKCSLRDEAWEIMCPINAGSQAEPRWMRNSMVVKHTERNLWVCFQRLFSQAPPRGRHSLGSSGNANVPSYQLLVSVDHCYYQPFGTSCLQPLDFPLGVCAETVGLNKLGEAGCWEREAECLWKGWLIVRPECWWLLLHHTCPIEVHGTNRFLPAFTWVLPCLHSLVQTFTLFSLSLWSPSVYEWPAVKLYRE